MSTQFCQGGSLRFLKMGSLWTLVIRSRLSILLGVLEAIKILVADLFIGETLAGSVKLEVQLHADFKQRLP